MKTHDAYTGTVKGEPLLSEEATDRAIYFIRNPLDVAVSFAHHNGFTVNEMIAHMADESYALCSREDRLANLLRQRLLSWSGHVLSWVEAPDLQSHLMRYEDMILDPENAFTAAARYAGLPSNRGRIRRALSFSRFAELRRQEQADGFREKNPRAPSFFRKGEIGSWREVLTEDQVRRLVSDHGEVMKRFGYLDDRGEPLV
jgi:hypothetical protein